MNPTHTRQAPLGGISIPPTFLAAILTARANRPGHKEGKVEILRLGKSGAPSGLEKQYERYKVVYTPEREGRESLFVVVETPVPRAGEPGMLSLIEPNAGVRGAMHAIARIRVFIFQLDVLEARGSNQELAQFVREHSADFLRRSYPQ